MKLTFSILGLLLLVFLTACSGLFLDSSEETPTSSAIPVTLVPTATIVWFPPTNTPTIFPTLTILPTPDLRPGMGDLLLNDSFDQPELWNTSTGSQASATVTGDKLLLSISGQGPLSISSLRAQLLLGDFYAEVNVTLSLCGDQDQFGVIYRAAPGDNFYRFVVRCNGQVRMERSLSGSRQPLHDWLSSGDAPSAAPAQIKLGMWVAGNEMRFFLNDNYQFTVRDPILHQGTLGFFVYANGSTPITASFSDLSVYSVTYVSPTPSLTPSRTPIPSRTPRPSLTATPTRTPSP
jgi:hypothetical protein